LRRKLKQIHHELKLTLIYVTHDQVEALTFADEVLVMSRGKVVQLGTPEALFERPAHTFVGHFIGSPGMNFIPARRNAGQLHVAGQVVTPAAAVPAVDGDVVLGIRPEYLRPCAAGEAGAVLARVEQVQDIGTYDLVSCRLGEQLLKLRTSSGSFESAPGATVHLRLLCEQTRYYQNEVLVS
jgi:glycerol transport system ATP-binding protein